MTISHNLVTNVSAWFFWNTVNFVDFSVIHVSQGSVAIYVRCGGMSTQHCIANFLLSLSVKEFLNWLRFDKVTAQSLVAFFFLEHSVDGDPAMGVLAVKFPGQTLEFQHFLRGFPGPMPFCSLRISTF